MALIRSISGGWAISRRCPPVSLHHQIQVMKQQAARSNDLSHLSPPCLGRWRQERALADYDGFERGMAEALIKKFIISCPYLEVWQCCFTRSVSLENSHRLCRCPCGNQVTAHGKRLVACCCFWGKLGRLACWAEWCLLNTSNYSIITSVCFMQLKHLNHVSRHGFP